MKASAVALSAVLLATLGGCLSTPPAAPSESTCQNTNTAFLTFSNASVTNLTYDVVLDGSKLTVVAPGVTTGSYTVPDSVPHTVLFNVSGTTNAACPPTTAASAACTTTNYVCRA